MCARGLAVSLLILAIGTWSGSVSADQRAVLLPGLEKLGVSLELRLPNLAGSGQDLRLAIGRPSNQSLSLGLPTGLQVSASLPGLDGLNVAPATQSMQGLTPELQQVLMEQTDPAVLMHLRGRLSDPLPGLGEARSAPLPGLDGLPVSLPAQ